MPPFRVRFLFLTGLAAALFVPARAAAQPMPATLRVMSYNIHHGEGLDQKLDLERIAALIRDANVDVVGLQEVDRGVERTAKRDLPAELAKLTGMTVHFENNFPFQGGEYGNAVLSRFPAKRVTNTRYKMLHVGEQRGVLQVVLDVKGRDVLFLNTHLDYKPNEPERDLNVAELKGIVAAAGRMPVILMGDFNAFPSSRPIVAITAFLSDTWTLVGQGDGFTIPVKKPTKRIDYIFITPETITPVAMKVLHSEASDHLPVFAELRLR